MQSTFVEGGAGDRMLIVDGPLYMGDVIRTGPSGQAQITLLDNTKLVVGPNSYMTVDAFVFDSNNQAKKVTLNAVRGAFRFLTGTSRKDAYTIKTPTATIGVRGTEFDFSVAADRWPSPCMKAKHGSAIAVGNASCSAIHVRSRSPSASARCVRRFRSRSASSSLPRRSRSSTSRSACAAASGSIRQAAALRQPASDRAVPMSRPGGPASPRSVAMAEQARFLRSVERPSAARLHQSVAATATTVSAMVAKAARVRPKPAIPARVAVATATIIERTSLQSVRDAVSLGALAGWFGREIIGVTGPDVDREIRRGLDIDRRRELPARRCRKTLAAGAIRGLADCYAGSDARLAFHLGPSRKSPASPGSRGVSCSLCLGERLFLVDHPLFFGVLPVDAASIFRLWRKADVRTALPNVRL